MGGPGPYQGATIRPFLVQAARRAELERGDHHGAGTSDGLSELARRYADRFGGRPVSAARLFQRVLVGTTLRETTADRLATFLGLHLDLL